MIDNNEIERYLKIFMNEHNITTFSPSTIEQISKIDYGELWNLVCNLIETYYKKILKKKIHIVLYVRIFI